MQEIRRPLKRPPYLILTQDGFKQVEFQDTNSSRITYDSSQSAISKITLRNYLDYTAQLHRVALHVVHQQNRDEY